MKSLEKLLLPSLPLIWKILWWSLIPSKIHSRRWCMYLRSYRTIVSHWGCKICHFRRVWLQRNSSPLWRWTIFITLNQVWASSAGPKYVFLDHNWDQTMISHHESLKMENPWAWNFVRRWLWSVKERCPYMMSIMGHLVESTWCLCNHLVCGPPSASTIAANPCLLQKKCLRRGTKRTTMPPFEEPHASFPHHPIISTLVWGVAHSGNLVRSTWSPRNRMESFLQAWIFLTSNLMGEKILPVLVFVLWHPISLWQHIP